MLGVGGGAGCLDDLWRRKIAEIVESHQDGKVMGRGFKRLIGVEEASVGARRWQGRTQVVVRRVDPVIFVGATLGISSGGWSTQP